jgi:ketosteroid isomerase-like protein
MAHPNEDLVREGYAAFGRGDIDALRRNFFAEDSTTTSPARALLGGDYEGVAHVLEWLGRQFELSGGTISAEVHDVVANDEHAVALITVRGERAGKQLEDNGVQVFHFRDGRVSEIGSHPADLYAVDEFWS